METLVPKSLRIPAVRDGVLNGLLDGVLDGVGDDRRPIYIFERCRRRSSRSSRRRSRSSRRSKSRNSRRSILAPLPVLVIVCVSSTKW